jgi:hypothetical protein
MSTISSQFWGVLARMPQQLNKGSFHLDQTSIIIIDSWKSHHATDMINDDFITVSE